MAQAAVENGADALLISGWTAGTRAESLKAALEGSAAIWGVELAAEAAGEDGILKRAQEAGASFAVLASGAPARTLFEEVDEFDRVLALDPPRDDLGLLLLRTQNLLPMQAALVRTDLSADALARLDVAGFARLSVVVESLQWPALVTLAEAPRPESVTTAVRLGAAGLVLSGASSSASAVGAAVQALREQLEKTRVPREGKSMVFLGGLAGAGAATPMQPRRESEPEPEHE